MGFKNIDFMKIKLAIIMMISSLIFSCKRDNREYKGLIYNDYKENDFIPLPLSEEKSKTIKIPPISYYEIPISMSRLLDTCYTVSLETNSKNLIGRIDEIKVVDEFIFILDSRKSKGVFMFDLNGKYLRRIGEVGGGPAEYPFPGDMAINEKNKEIFIFNGNVRKIYKYNFQGEFLGKIPLELGGYSINITKDGDIMLFCQGYSNDHLGELKNKAFYVINQEGEIISFGPTQSNDFKNVKITNGNNISVKNQEISYCNKFSDTIYKIKEDLVNIQYILDFGENSLNREKFKNLKTKKFLNEIRDDDNLIPNFRGIHYQTNNYLYFSFYYGQTIINCYFNKNTSKLYASKIIDFSNVNCLYSFVAKASYKDYFISSLDALNLVDSRDNMLGITDSQWKKSSSQTMEIMNDLNVKATDNPVLIFYKLKENI